MTSPQNFRSAGEQFCRLCRTAGTNEAELRSLLEAMQQAFADSFLNYTEENPGHWFHPDGTWSGHPDQPSDGMPVILAFLEAEKRFGKNPERRDWVRRYFQFLAAVIPALDPENRLIAAEGAGKAAAFFPDEPVFLTLQKAFSDSVL